MFKVELTNIIQMLIEKELDSQSLPEYSTRRHNKTLQTTYTRKGLIIDFSLRVTNYNQMGDNNLKIKEEQRYFFLLFTGNTSVFYVERILNNGLKRLSEIQPNEWINTCNHDSCWRSDGFNFLTQIYFDMCERVCPGVAPCFVDSSASLGFLFNYPVKHVMVTYIYTDNYKKEIIKIQ